MAEWCLYGNRYADYLWRTFTPEQPRGSDWAHCMFAFDEYQFVLQQVDVHVPLVIRYGDISRLDYKKSWFGNKGKMTIGTESGVVHVLSEMDFANLRVVCRFASQQIQSIRDG